MFTVYTLDPRKADYEDLQHLIVILKSLWAMMSYDFLFIIKTFFIDT